MESEFQLPTSLDPAPIAVVADWLKGKRLEKFQESVDVINSALSAGGWVGRGSQKSHKGFGQGLVTRVTRDNEVAPYGHPQHTAVFEAYMALAFGRRCEENVSDEHLAALCPKTPVEVSRAWIQVCGEASKVRGCLNQLRPLPVKTEIGLSPRVTKTLTETTLAIDLPTIKPAEIKTRWARARDKKTGKPAFDSWGKPAYFPVYYVAWTPGTKFGKSRHGIGCEACGKDIPSGRYVPIEADCSKHGHIGLWVGVDCAKSIFGVKDKGIERG